MQLFRIYACTVYVFLKECSKLNSIGVVLDLLALKFASI